MALLSETNITSTGKLPSSFTGAQLGTANLLTDILGDIGGDPSFDPGISSGFDQDFLAESLQNLIGAQQPARDISRQRVTDATRRAGMLSSGLAGTVQADLEGQFAVQDKDFATQLGGTFFQEQLKAKIAQAEEQGQGSPAFQQLNDLLKSSAVFRESESTGTQDSTFMDILKLLSGVSGPLSEAILGSDGSGGLLGLISKGISAGGSLIDSIFGGSSTDFGFPSFGDSFADSASSLFGSLSGGTGDFTLGGTDLDSLFSGLGDLDTSSLFGGFGGDIPTFSFDSFSNASGATATLGAGSAGIDPTGTISAIDPSGSLLESLKGLGSDFFGSSFFSPGNLLGMVGGLIPGTAGQVVQGISSITSAFASGNPMGAIMFLAGMISGKPTNPISAFFADQKINERKHSAQGFAQAFAPLLQSVGLKDIGIFEVGGGGKTMTPLKPLTGQLAGFTNSMQALQMMLPGMGGTDGTTLRNGALMRWVLQNSLVEQNASPQQVRTLMQRFMGSAEQAARFIIRASGPLSRAQQIESGEQAGMGGLGFHLRQLGDDQSNNFAQTTFGPKKIEDIKKMAQWYKEAFLGIESIFGPQRDTQKWFALTGAAVKRLAALVGGGDAGSDFADKLENANLSVSDESTDDGLLMDSMEGKSLWEREQLLDDYLEHQADKAD